LTITQTYSHDQFQPAEFTTAEVTGVLVQYLDNGSNGILSTAITLVESLGR